MKAMEKFYLVNSQGVRENFEGMPDGAYAAIGFNETGTNTGDLYKMIFPSTLTPLFNEDGTRARTTEKRAGKVYSKRAKAWRNE